MGEGVAGRLLSVGGVVDVVEAVSSIGVGGVVNDAFLWRQGRGVSLGEQFGVVLTDEMVDVVC